MSKKPKGSLKTPLDKNRVNSGEPLRAIFWEIRQVTIYDQLQFLWKFVICMNRKIPKIFLLAPLVSMLEPFLDFR